MNALQQLQQEMSNVATSPKEYEQMVLAMQEADKFAKQTNVQEMQEGGFIQKQEQEGVGAYVPPPKQTFDMTPVQMQQGGLTSQPFVNVDPNNMPPAGMIGGALKGKEYVEEVSPDGMRSVGFFRDPNQGSFTGNVTSEPMFRQPGDMGRYVAANDPGQPYAGFSSMADYQASLQKSVPTGTYTGKNVGDISAEMIETPKLPTGAAITPALTQQTTGQDIDAGVGQVSGQVAIPTAMAATATAQGIQKTPAQQMQEQQVQQQVQNVTDATQAQQGAITQTIAPQTLDKSSVSELQAAQGTATQMVNPVQRQIQSGELVSSVANAQTASQYTEQIQEATATPTKKATVAGQLEGLMQQFEGGNTPSWAAGALRNVTAEMARRGLGASSMAGQAMVQAAMESALPIAQIDAQTQAQFEAQNLSNRQQRAMLAAQQRATFIGQEFDQAFQARVQNASKIGDIANMNFTAEQQIALENSRAVQTVNMANLNNRQAMVIAEASALANMDLSNLNNRQQAGVQNAQNFLQLDMANLSNRQQTELFKSQQRVQSLFTDQAATNASRQFNATSQNQVDQFFANLASQTGQYNASQINAQQQFNAGQSNVVERFNAELNNQRDQFNAQNQTVIAQSNAQWRRQIATADTAALNRANEVNAQSLLGISNQAYNNLWQYYGDTMEWAWKSAENERERVKDLTAAQINASAATDAAKIKGDYESSSSIGSVVLPILLKGAFGIG
jgi:hypothetical protein